MAWVPATFTHMCNPQDLELMEALNSRIILKQFQMNNTLMRLQIDV